MKKTKNTALFSPPVFASRVLRARMLAELKGAAPRWTWNEERYEFVLEGGEATGHNAGQ